MEFSLLLFLFILNFLLVLELLTISQIISFLIYITNRKTINFALNNLTIWLWSHQSSLSLPLLPHMLALRTTLLYLYCIHTSTIIPLQRPSIMQFILPVLKWKFLLSGVVSTKPQILIAFPRLLLSPILFIQLEKSLILLHILTKFSQQLYFLIFENFSYITRTTLLNSGNAPVISIGLFIKQSIRKQRSLI